MDALLFLLRLQLPVAGLRCQGIHVVVQLEFLEGIGCQLLSPLIRLSHPMLYYLQLSMNEGRVGPA